MPISFNDMLKAKWAEGKFACVGLDSEYEKLPVFLRDGTSVSAAITMFNRAIVGETRDFACAYKPNFAFYMAHGSEGLKALYQTIACIRIVAPTVPVILDGKFGDIGNTNEGYAKLAFDYLGADAVTVSPYLSGVALKPFLDRKDKGVFVLCRTSNLGSDEFQDLSVSGVATFALGNISLYKHVASRVSKVWNVNGNCGLVVGATYPDELREVRGAVGDMPILIPGIGAQGGDVEKTVRAGKDSRGQGMIINSSRGIIFASQAENFATAAGREAEKLHNLINQFR